MAASIANSMEWFCWVRRRCFSLRFYLVSVSNLCLWEMSAAWSCHRDFWSKTRSCLRPNGLKSITQLTTSPNFTDMIMISQGTHAEIHIHWSLLFTSVRANNHMHTWDFSIDPPILCCPGCYIPNIDRSEEKKSILCIVVIVPDIIPELQILIIGSSYQYTCLMI